MRKERILTGYTNMSDAELSTLASRVLKAMQDPISVANFPAPVPDLETIETVVTDYLNKHVIASHRGSGVQIGEKNSSRLLLLNHLRDLAQYINRVAEGQVPLLLSTGFNLAGQPVNNLEPLTSEWIHVKDGRYSGELRVDVAVVKSAWEYEVQVGVINGEGAVDWSTTVLSTRSRGIIIDDRVPGIRYLVRTRARNGKGYGDWTDPVYIVAR